MIDANDIKVLPMVEKKCLQRNEQLQGAQILYMKSEIYEQLEIISTSRVISSDKNISYIYKDMDRTCQCCHGDIHKDMDI